MKAEFRFRTASSVDLAREGVRLFLLGSGWSQSSDEAGSLSFTRGSALRRLTSLKVEQWPTTLRVLFVEIDRGQTGVMLRYEVRTGAHLVGTLERGVLETEAVLLEEHLVSGIRRDLDQTVAPLRRPVIIATGLNMTLAVVVVAWVGMVGQFPAVWVILAATLIAFLDGVVIMAFADLLVEGSRLLPRLRGQAAVTARLSGEPAPSEPASPS